MSWNNQSSNTEENPDVNLSPLLDMVFILLIFFVVTTTFNQEAGVEVKKPKSSTATQVSQDKILKVAVTREGTFHIFEKQVSLDVLESILVREKTKLPSVKLIILADKDSTTDSLVQVIDKANLAGIKATSISTQNE